MTALFLTCLALASCGGSEDAPNTTDLANHDDNAMRVRRMAATDGWAACATEGGWCTFSGPRVVHYGDSTVQVHRTLSNGTACSNAVFGDPLPGIVKRCWIEPAPPAPQPNSAWTSCAAENGVCTFEGVLQVRYGAGSSWVTRPMGSPVTCSNATFGDPIMGVVKSCAYVAAAAAPAPTPTDPCMGLPALPSVPAARNVVTDFCVRGQCARPDDDIDDTDAIDLALSQSAGRFLVFPPGRYLIKRSLRVKQGGVTLWGPGATIHATNWDDQSIIVEADGTSIYGFRLTAATGQRGSRAEHTRIAIYGPASVNPVVKNTVIRNNQIVDDGSAFPNSATGAGIFVNAADGFLIAGNTVARSLADGIHVTGGARNGRVLANTVRETGDDMIAVVSYAYPDPWTNTAATITEGYATNQARYQDRNLLIADNRLSGQYWGRGIAVVGGRDITIRNNTLSNLPYGAAVLLARETSSGTYGLDNVLVQGNTITDEQTLNPPYDFGGKFAANGRTGHGAIEVHGSMFVDELAVPALAAGFTVGNLAIVDNVITASATPGVRIGVGHGTTWTMGNRPVTGSAPLRNIVVSGNRMTDIRTGSPVQLLSGAGVAACSGNTLAGNAIVTPQCAATAPAPRATGATLTCPVP